ERLATLRDLLVSVLLLAAGLDILSELIEPRLTRILFENAERIAQQAAMLARIGDRLGFCRRAIKSMLEAKASDGRLDLACGIAHTDLRLFLLRNETRDARIDGFRLFPKGPQLVEKLFVHVWR